MKVKVKGRIIGQKVTTANLKCEALTVRVGMIDMPAMVVGKM